MRLRLGAGAGRLAHFFQLIRLFLEGLPIVWAEAEASLANLAKLALDLRRMLPTLEAEKGCAPFGEQPCDLLVEPTEIRIVAANLRVAGPTVERDRGTDQAPSHATYRSSHLGCEAIFGCCLN